MKMLATKKLIAAAALAATTATVLPTAPATAQGNYGVYLTGVQVVQMRTNADDPYIIAYMVDQNGNVSQPVFIPGQNEPWRNVRVGDVFRLDQRVWYGPEQTVQLQAHVYQYETGLRDFVAGFTSVTTKIAGALVAVGTGGLGAAGGVAVGLAGEAAAQAVRDTAGDSIPLGEANVTLELARAGSLADGPTNEHLGIYYDFYTEHNWNGAVYGLFWEVRRQ
ncbi:MAG: hypothetical protein R3F55_19500 [Alphaproteobacteria bacterium]